MRMRVLAVLVVLVLIPTAPVTAVERPNVVILYADDLGYGDLGCYGHPTIRTPNLDRMAAEGMRFTSFYSAAEVCTPSRASLLTGRLPPRSGMCHDTRRVLFPNSLGGLPHSEITLAKALKERGYTTACVGKWHLGHLPEYLPMRHGFDTFYGIPYVNDMDRVADPKLGRKAFFEPKVEYFNVPLMRGDQIVERPAQQPLLTRRYTEESVSFIKANKERPFFLYLAWAMPHVPLFASEAFHGKSPRGLYGDTVEEIDWSVGQVLQALRDSGLSERTLVVFASDNGPWLQFNHHGGSAGLLRDGKGSTFEGGMRVPGIFWGPGLVKAGVVTQEMASTLDVFPTTLKLAGAAVPEDRVIDGYDLRPVLTGTASSPRTTMFYYRGTRLYAMRKGMFKAHFITQPAYGPGETLKHDPPLLYHLGVDPSEKFDIAKEHPDVIADIKAEVAKHTAGMKHGENQLERVRDTPK